MDQRTGSKDGDQQTAEPRASILIVDDHPANLVALEAILEPLGHELVMARSGEEALRADPAPGLRAHPARRADGGHERLRDRRASSSSARAAATSRSSSSPRSTATPCTSSAATRTARSTTWSSRSTPTSCARRWRCSSSSTSGARSSSCRSGCCASASARPPSARARSATAACSTPCPSASGRRTPTGSVNYWNRSGLAYCGLDAARRPGGIVLGVPAPRRSRRGARALGGRAAQRRPVRAPGAHQARRRRQLPLAPRARRPRARRRTATIVGWIATATDIDDQKRAEEALRKAIILRDDFLSVASHELRTPLTSLKLEVANLSRIARRDNTDERARA